MNKGGIQLATSLFVYEGNDFKIIKESLENSESYILLEYLKEVNKSVDYINVLGDLQGVVYRMNLAMSLDGIEREYMIVVNPMRKIPSNHDYN